MSNIIIGNVQRQVVETFKGWAYHKNQVIKATKPTLDEEAFISSLGGSVVPTTSGGKIVYKAIFF